jgi:hypothetical protein
MASSRPEADIPAGAAGVIEPLQTLVAEVEAMGIVEHLSRSNQGTALFRRNCLSSDPTPKANPASSSTSRSGNLRAGEIERHRMPISVGRSRGLRTCASCSRPVAR